ncbi:hypothetical protein [Trujillonella humicola]|uniref:hypothetical protein n=1 Tax=Trujillonella humicola TaxID=3383699 RepID=UPI0039062664
MPDERRGSELSEQVEADDTVLLFVGGPLDGRVEVRPARHGDPLPTVTHVHLHDGPKVVSRYDLQELPGAAGVYHLRPPARPRSRDEAARGREDSAG